MARGGWELALVALTGALHVLWPEQTLSRAWFIVPAVAGWAAYVGYLARTDPRTWDRLGLRQEGLRQTAAAVGGLLLVTLPPLFLWGLWTDAPFSWTLGVSFLLYPLWGLIQQMLVQGMVTGPLAQRLPQAPAVVLSSLLFGLVHVTEPLLVPATFALGLVLAPLWLRWRNLWPLALAHGWIGAVAYVAVLHRDPIAELFLRL